MDAVWRQVDAWRLAERVKVTCQFALPARRKMSLGRNSSDGSKEWHNSWQPGLPRDVVFASD